MNCQGYHDRAMELASQALTVKAACRKRSLLRNACNSECTAACLSKKQPTTAVLWRSAASLALEYGDVVRALHLAACGLESVKHDEIKEELLDVIRAAVKAA